MKHTILKHLKQKLLLQKTKSTYTLLSRVVAWFCNAAHWPMTAGGGAYAPDALSNDAFS